jgi:hypothetical protein
MVIDYVDHSSLAAGEISSVKTPPGCVDRTHLGSDSVNVASSQEMRVSRKAACIREHAPHTQ